MNAKQKLIDACKHYTGTVTTVNSQLRELGNQLANRRITKEVYSEQYGPLAISREHLQRSTIEAIEAATDEIRQQIDRWAEFNPEHASRPDVALLSGAFPLTAETLQQIVERNRDSSLILATVDEYARKHDIDRPEHPTAESKHLALDNLLRHVAADIRSANTPESEFDYVGDSDYIGSVLDGLEVNL